MSLLEFCRYCKQLVECCFKLYCNKLSTEAESILGLVFNEGKPLHASRALITGEIRKQYSAFGLKLILMYPDFCN